MSTNRPGTHAFSGESWESTEAVLRALVAGDEMPISDSGGQQAPVRPPTVNPQEPRLTRRNRNGRQRLAYGQLTALVLEHMHTWPHLDFSPYELAKVLGRSHGTIRRTLLGLTEAGTVTRTRQRPARFRITT